MERLLLARYGEIALKGRNRGLFEGLLAQNMRRALAPFPSFRIRRTHGRIYAEPRAPEGEAALDAAAASLGRVFGLVGVSVARRAPLDAVAVAVVVTDVAREAKASSARGGPRAETFKISASRAEKRFPLDSMQLNRDLGAAVLAADPSWRVDVHHPDLTIWVEIRAEGAFVYSDGVQAPGGLPVGSSGRAVALLSGGIDSPVALWYAMKRGLSVDALHFETPPFTSADARGKVVDLCRLLSPWGGPRRLHIVNFSPLQRLIWGRSPAALRVTLMRRLFLRIAERIAQAVRAEAIVTGDSLGQVASQTLRSMRAIGDATPLPVLRPLVAWDKSEIIEHAKRIGTFETSIRPFDDCCALFVPDHPATKPELSAVRAAEEGLGADELAAGLAEAVSAREVLSVGAAAETDEAAA